MKQGQVAFILVCSLLFFGYFFKFLNYTYAFDRSLIQERLRSRFTPLSKPIATPLPTPRPTPVPISRPELPANTKLFLFPGLRPTPTPNNPSNQKLDLMMKQINNYRQASNLNIITIDPYTCNFAQKRAKEIATDFNHNGFNQNSFPYPGFSYIVENISQNSDYTLVVPTWINSPGHATNLKADIVYGCVGYWENFYVFEGWRP